MNSPSAAWAIAANAVADILKGSPLPAGMVKCAMGSWKIRVNNSGAAVDHLPNFGIEMICSEYFRSAILHPSGGFVMGMHEADLIEEFRPYLLPHTLALYAEHFKGN